MFLPLGSLGPDMTELGAPILTPRWTFGEFGADADVEISEKVGYGFDVGIDESDIGPGSGALCAHILPRARTSSMIALVMECSISATPALLE
jgi:hypothetical protein